MKLAGALLTFSFVAPFLNAQIVEAPLTGRERAAWAIKNTIGPSSLVAGMFSAGLSTWKNQPTDYGTHWEGFGDRYGMRLTGIATSNAIEAGLGSVWGEDPRYRALGAGSPFRNRLGHAMLWTVVKAHNDGTIQPAYASFAGISGSAFLSSAWRADDEAGFKDGISRVEFGFLAKAGGNLFSEFLPDLKKMGHRKPKNDPFLQQP